LFDPRPHADRSHYYPLTFAGCFARAVARAPAGVAVIDGELRLSWADLHRRVHRLATMLAHAGLLSNATEVARQSQLGPGDVVLAAGGFTHLFGLLAVHAAIVRGATLVTQARYDPDRFLELCVRERVTHAWAVPAQLHDLAERAGNGERHTLNVREIRTAGAAAGAAAGADLRRAVRANLGVAPIVHWGMSELGGGITTADLTSPEVATDAIGRPIRGADVRIVGLDGAVCAPGEPGELHYRRADLFRGYYDAAELTAAAVTADGFLRTGDRAAVDGDGIVAFHGRLNDLINRGGMKISALEVETLLDGVPGLRRAAIVGVPDARLGERATLVCTLHERSTLT
ncbi:MAG: class I adenylate-forming enzyme family protein, partial [Vulcanimicrobiaceae bacterium]